MDGWRILAAVLGLGIVAATVLSAIETVVLPRATQSFIARTVFRLVAMPFRALASERRDYLDRDRVMARYGPIALFVLGVSWMSLILVGFTTLLWGAAPWLGAPAMGWEDAFHLSGSSLTTLGFAPAPTTRLRIVAFAEAGMGLFMAALLITYLPSLYSVFSRRERQVALLEVRAGSPPSAREFVLRHHRIGWLDDLAEYWLDWERWFAEVEESHTSYPIVAFFRSPRPERSWVTAAGTVLDAASFLVSAVETGTPPAPAGVCIRSGYLALRRIADGFGITYDSDPAPDAPISITRPEFDAVCDELAAAGVPLVADREQAWRDFAGWRVNYDTVLLALAEILMAPIAPWTSDRSPPDHRKRTLRRFGSRRLGKSLDR